MEFALKARICHTLGWTVYKTASEDYRSFKTHKLLVLLELSGRAAKINQHYLGEWSIVERWATEDRYRPLGQVKAQDAEAMIHAAKRILRAL